MNRDWAHGNWYCRYDGCRVRMVRVEHGIDVIVDRLLDVHSGDWYGRRLVATAAVKDLWLLLLQIVMVVAHNWRLLLLM